MIKFLSLDEEKQRVIRNAALKVFGQHNYQKTSIKDITNEAGIAKSMIFYYFGTKKKLYFYLVDYCTDVLTEGLDVAHRHQSNDYFERMELATRKQLTVLKDEPFLLPFLMTMMQEQGVEVQEDLDKYRAKAVAFQNDYGMNGIDFSKFKKDINIETLLKTMMWMAEGFSAHISVDSEEGLERSIEAFIKSLNLLKAHLYKEEYL